MREFCLRISGDFACFTRPEMKIERVSYDVITPSAVRAVFEAICWKPAIRWIPTKIEVLRPIKWINLRRNEVGGIIPKPDKKMMAGGEGNLGFYIEENRQQRAGCFLQNVAYRVHAKFEMTEKAGKADNWKKFADIFTRRAEKGQCFNQPYLGCREFSADFRLITDAKADDESSISEDADLGFMLYDIDFNDGNTPMMFRATMKKGVITIPLPDSDEIRR